MMTETLLIAVKCLAAILAGIFAGNGAVYCFNHMPADWLCDYGQTPSEELLDTEHQRVKSHPWKYLLTMAFVAVSIKLVMDDWRFAVAAIFAIWLLVLIAMADLKYRVIPDQLVALLAVTALGFIAFHASWLSCLYGALTGFGVMGCTALLGKLAYRREALGGGDIKLFASLGLITGFWGILLIFVLTSLLSAGHLVWLLARKKINRRDAVPMAPYIALATMLYLLFFWGISPTLYL